MRAPINYLRCRIPAMQLVSDYVSTHDTRRTTDGGKNENTNTHTVLVAAGLPDMPSATEMTAQELLNFASNQIQNVTKESASYPPICDCSARKIVDSKLASPTHT
jgi:hypothetical protein